VDPVPDQLYSENLVAPGIEPGTSRLAARNCDYFTTEAVRRVHTADFIRHPKFLFEATFRRWRLQVRSLLNYAQSIELVPITRQ
jgi:hypothetical protein